MSRPEGRTPASTTRHVVRQKRRDDASNSAFCWKPSTFCSCDSRNAQRARCGSREWYAALDGLPHAHLVEARKVVLHEVGLQRHVRHPCEVVGIRVCARRSAAGAARRTSQVAAPLPPSYPFARGSDREGRRGTAGFRQTGRRPRAARRGNVARKPTRHGRMALLRSAVRARGDLLQTWSWNRRYFIQRLYPPKSSSPPSPERRTLIPSSCAARAIARNRDPRRV